MKLDAEMTSKMDDERFVESASDCIGVGGYVMIVAIPHLSTTTVV